MKAFDRVLICTLLLLSFRAEAHYSSAPHHEWFNKQEMNPAVSTGSAFRTSRAAITAMCSKPASGSARIARISGNI